MITSLVTSPRRGHRDAVTRLVTSRAGPCPGRPMSWPARVLESERADTWLRPESQWPRDADGRGGGEAVGGGRGAEKSATDPIIVESCESAEPDSVAVEWRKLQCWMNR